MQSHKDTHSHDINKRNWEKVEIASLEQSVANASGGLNQVNVSEKRVCVKENCDVIIITST